MSSAATRLRPTSSSREAARTEDLALLLGGIGAVAGAVTGLLVLSGTSALFGRGSIGELGALVAMATGGLAFVVTAWRESSRTEAWLRSLSWPRRAVNVIGLGLLHAVLALLVVSGGFAVFATAFRGVALDPWASTFWVALAGGGAAYACAISASALSVRSLANLLAGFLAAGALASALSATDPGWWRHHFSALGTESGGAGVTFAVTLLLTGFALTTVGDSLAHDVGVWARARGEGMWKAQYVRVMLLVLGVLVMVVALIPVNRDKAWHDAAAQAVIVVFAVALIGFPVIFRRLHGGFHVVTGVTFALLVLLLVLYKGVDYLGTTAFEMGAGATVLAWLILFTRAIAAAVSEVDDGRAVDAMAAQSSDLTRSPSRRPCVSPRRSVDESKLDPSAPASTPSEADSQAMSR